MMPGRILHRLASSICSRRALEQVIEPAIADLQKEYSDASPGAPGRRAWVLFRSYISVYKLFMAIGIGACVPSDEERPQLVRTLTGIALALTLFTAVLVALPAAMFPALIEPFHIALLVPQALPLTIPLAIVLGIGFGMGGRRVPHRTIRVMMLATVVCSAASFATLGWVMPAANQSYRQALFEAQGNRGLVMKGTSEMTLPELGAALDRMKTYAPQTDSRSEAWSYHLRWALSAASFTMAAFIFAPAWRGKSLPRRIIIAAPCLYLLLLYAGESLVTRSVMSPVAGAWLPNIVFSLAAARLSTARLVIEPPHGD